MFTFLCYVLQINHLPPYPPSGYNPPTHNTHHSSFRNVNFPMSMNSLPHQGNGMNSKLSNYNVSSNGSVGKEHYGWWPSPPTPAQSQLQQSSSAIPGNHASYNSMFFNPSQSSLSMAAAVASMMPASARKSRRCRCPNCLSGVQPTQGNIALDNFHLWGKVRKSYASTLFTVPGEKKKKRQHICHIIGCGKVRDCH